ncbi:hypothetical protein C8R47DRAFT_173078 [Mycena vitilis]|nr:hypothetical protein C8R47DRAFT_173078 [Mycena vitilis]
MISHATLYSLANSLGVLAMVTVVGYHFVAVNQNKPDESTSRVVCPSQLARLFCVGPPQSLFQ